MLRSLVEGKRGMQGAKSQPGFPGPDDGLLILLFLMLMLLLSSVPASE
jgi:hypothetical protein